MDIAAYTKSTLTDHPARLRILDALRASGEFSISEIQGSMPIPQGTERLLVFGGDGTMLDAAVRAARSGAAVLGVNLGNLGFLTQFETDASPEDIAAALIGGETESRMLLECRSAAGNFLALNDVVLRSDGTRPLTVSLFVDGQFADCYRSDGVIVATPTGSTAYSLSAGGPVVAPEVDAVIVNPVCPHTLHSRPIVAGGSSEIILRLSSEESARLVVDGRDEGGLRASSVIAVRRSQTEARFVKVGESRFYERLLSKMNRWGTTA